MSRRRKVGAVREKLAEMLRGELTRMGIDFVHFDGDALLPVKGYWKSQDVYRWESVGLDALHPETGGRMGMSINGWEAMTKIVRAGGVSLSADRMIFQYEAWGCEPGSEASDEALLSDANSRYSDAQNEEIARTALASVPGDGR